MPRRQQPESSRVVPHVLNKSDVMPDLQFTALRLWAMDFGGVTRSFGIAFWPAFRYTPAQRERLHSIANAFSRGAQVVWKSIVGVISFFFMFFLAFLPITPFITGTSPPYQNGVAYILVLGGMFANLALGSIFGSVIGSWIGGRLIHAVIPLPPLDQADGDQELLTRIRRQIGWVAIIFVLCAAEPTLVRLLF